MYKNRYSFIWNEHNIVVTPLKPSKACEYQLRIAKDHKMRAKQLIRQEQEKNGKKRVVQKKEESGKSIVECNGGNILSEKKKIKE